MKINGNLQFRTLGSGELQNAIIERLASAPTGEPGRIYFNTTDNFYYFYGAGSPAVWEKVAPGSVVSNILTSMGYVNVDGTFDPTLFSSFVGVGSPVSLYDVLAQTVGTITAAGYDLIQDATTADQRTTLGLVAGGAGDIWVEKAGDIMTGHLVMMSGTHITLPEIPQNDTDAVNKAYVDQIAANIRWRDPIMDPDLVDIVPSEPTPHNTVPVGDTQTYIKWGGVQEENWAGSINKVSDGDVISFEVTISGSPLVGEWRRIGTLAVGTRFIIAAEHGDIHPTLEGLGFNIHDLIEYTGQVGSPPYTGSPAGGPYDPAAWSRPEGVAGIDGSPQIDFGSPSNEIPGGTTVLCNAPLSFHANHSYSYNQTPEHEWVEIAGPGAVGAGDGLSYSGTELRVNFGAGITQLPVDEVGIDLYDATTGALILAEGSPPTRSTTSDAQLYLLLKTLGGLVQDATGLWVDLPFGDLNNYTDTGATPGDVPVVTDGSPLTYLAQPLQFNYDSTLHGGPATSHTVTHNLNQRFVNVDVYKQAGSPVEYSQVIPQSVTLDSSTQLTVTFNASLECLVVVMGVPGIGLA